MIGEIVLKKTLNTKLLARAGIMTGISVVLMMVLEFPLPFMPPFLKIDLSNIPILVLAFSLGSAGPVAGLLAVIVKDLIHLLVTSTGGVGELADCLCAVMLVVPSAFIYSRKHTKKGAVLALCVGIILMTLMGVFANKFILLPFYSKLMPLDAIFEMCGRVNPWVNSEMTYILYGVIPFNILKGIILSGITMLIYKHISNIFHR